VETGYLDNGKTDYGYAQGIIPSVDGGVAHAWELEPHCESNWDVQVRCFGQHLELSFTGLQFHWDQP